ncbi:MAG: hypothetical protein J1F35_03530 [Erysipelotrichales bacterium]|nr:hypothetical protein [Erysipelotrichales bacterium]
MANYIQHIYGAPVTAPGVFIVGASSPLDYRIIVSTFDDLLDPENNFKYDGKYCYIYEGMQVYVKDESVTYMFIGKGDSNGILLEDVKKEENWIKVNSGEGVPDWEEIEDKLDELNPYKEITWEELVDLRNSKELLKGCNYRIIDYVCTISDDLLGIDVKENQFDIIVTAISENALSEEAKVIHHKGDTYFANNKLEAWKIWYCLDNDTDRFSWANEEDGKGIIYRMIDEFGNDCPYDFKNILFVRYLNDDSEIYDRIDQKDEEITNTKLCYTFENSLESDNEAEPKDASVSSAKNNIIKPYYISRNLTDGNTIESLIQELNNNVFYGNSKNNSLDVDCHHNTFMNNCCNNILGKNCCNNVLGKESSNNILKDNCSNNIFKDYCIFNELGEGSRYNSFDLRCNLNILGKANLQNSLGSYCTNNIFGLDCCDNIISGNNFNNTLKNNCKGNKIGIDSNFNVLSEDCNDNILGGNVMYANLGIGCYNNIFGWIEKYDILYKPIESVITLDQKNIKSSYIKLDDGVSFVVIHPTEDSIIKEEDYLTNIYIHRGVHGGIKDYNNQYSISAKYPILQIEIDTFSQDYEINISKDKNGELTFWTT